MKLSFKKSILLFTTVALSSMLGVNATDNVIVEGYTFEQEWKSTEVPKTNTSDSWAHYRQGFGQDNQFYIQNKDPRDDGKIEIYNQSGYVSDFHESGYGSNLTKMRLAT